MKVDLRLAALRRFATAITALNIVGHTVLGFEQSVAQVLAAIGTGYVVEILLELIDAHAAGRRPQFLGGAVALVDFLLPAHITALACSMLLYPNERIAPIVFAVAVAVSSKAIFRVPVAGGERHFFNPSNTGIATTLLVFPSVSVAPPYQFTERVTGIWDWVVPAIIVCSGTFLNARFTKKLPLIGGWLGGFALQAVLRSSIFGTPVAAPLAMMTGLAFLLFTFYMVTDPATTPVNPKRQVLFGLSVAGVYALLQVFHVVFGLFFSLLVVCTLRGVALQVLAARQSARAISLTPSIRGVAAETTER